MIDPRSYPFRRHLAALIWIVPALAAVWALPAEAPYASMLFDGGAEVFRHNLYDLILIPYVGLFILALGALFLPKSPTSGKSRLVPADFELIRFFGGAGLLVVLGFALGAAKLLFAWVTIPIFTAVLYLHLLASPAPLARFLGWLNTTDLLECRMLRAVGGVCRGVICLLVLLIVVEKGIVIDLNQNDALQLYFPYFSEVRRQHGIWLDPAHPIIFSFFVGRGHGVQLFFTSFTDQFFIQVISVIYFLSIAMVVRRVVSVIIPRNVGPSSWQAARAIFPDCAVLLALSSPLLQLDPGKFHFETGAFLIFLSWASLLFVFTDSREAKWLGYALLPVVIAMPIAIPQTQAVVTLILALAAVVIHRIRGKQFARIQLYLILAGCVVAALSLLVNQLYLGLAEVNPYQFFLKFVNQERFQKWSSLDLLIYVNNAQGFQYLNDFSTAADSFLASIGKLAEAGRVDIRRTGFSLSTLPAVIFALLAALMLVLSGHLRRRQHREARQLLDEGADILVVSFFSMYVVASLMISLSGHGSLRRLMSYLDAYPAIFFILAFVLCGAAFRRLVCGTEAGVARDETSLSRGGLGAAFRKMGLRYGMASVIVICTISLIVTAFNVRTKEVGILERINITASALGYFFGAERLVDINKPPVPYYNARRFAICLKLGKIIPSGERILPLNSIFGVVPACSDSPLLLKGKVQDTLHYVFARQFRQAVLGEPVQSYAILNSYDVNYFLVEKGDPYFWGPGVADIFSPENLEANCDVYYEDDIIFIFTWRGKGSRPVSKDMVEELRRLHEAGRRATPFYYESLRYLRRWIAEGGNGRGN